MSENENFGSHHHPQRRRPFARRFGQPGRGGRRDRRGRFFLHRPHRRDRRESPGSLYQNRFEDYGQQKNFALQKAGHDWIINLDADERVSPELKKAIIALKEKGAPEKVAAYAIKRKAFYLGRWIGHSGWYPDRKVRLFRKNGSVWQGRIHEGLQVSGVVAPLAGDILHYTYRDINDQVRRLNRYSGFQAEEIVRSKKCLFLRLLRAAAGDVLEALSLAAGVSRRFCRPGHRHGLFLGNGHEILQSHRQQTIGQGRPRQLKKPCPCAIMEP